uniref:Uncharacterized protein n=1 Tax=Lepeophtheirus salmonis TaxID=72036 RepID=A0A0K2TUI4_LEPSM
MGVKYSCNRHKANISYCVKNFEVMVLDSGTIDFGNWNHTNHVIVSPNNTFNHEA